MGDLSEPLSITFTLPTEQAAALSQLLKRLARSNLGPGNLGLDSLDLPSRQFPGEEYDARQAVRALADVLSRAGFGSR